MKITKTYNWNRRDFCFDSECEHCGHKETNHSGYDDSNYYQNVVPDMKCDKCGESSNTKESNAPKTVVVPKYDSHVVM
jgi:hypothetical protein